MNNIGYKCIPNTFGSVEIQNSQMYGHGDYNPLRYNWKTSQYSQMKPPIVPPSTIALSSISSQAIPQSAQFGSQAIHTQTVQPPIVPPSTITSSSQFESTSSQFHTISPTITPSSLNFDLIRSQSVPSF